MNVLMAVDSLAPLGGGGRYAASSTLCCVWRFVVEVSTSSPSTSTSSYFWIFSCQVFDI